MSAQNGRQSGTPTRKKRELRLESIRAQLMSVGATSVEDLTELTGVSRMTIHRDLDELVQRGVVHRTRGGASVEKTFAFEASVESRLSMQRTAKDAIAQHAITLVEPGQVVLIDDSTTSYAFYRNLPSDLPVTVVSNFLPVIHGAAVRPNTQLIALGGDYAPSYQAFFGLVTETSLATVHADLLIASASALRGGSVFHQNQLAISTRRAMIDSAARRFLLLDSSKVGRTALYLSGSVEDYDDLIVDDRVDREALVQLADLDIRVHVAE